MTAISSTGLTESDCLVSTRAVLSTILQYYSRYRVLCSHQWHRTNEVLHTYYQLCINSRTNCRAIISTMSGCSKVIRSACRFNEYQSVHDILVIQALSRNISRKVLFDADYNGAVLLHYNFIKKLIQRKLNITNDNKLLKLELSYICWPNMSFIVKGFSSIIE